MNFINVHCMRGLDPRYYWVILGDLCDFFRVAGRDEFDAVVDDFGNLVAVDNGPELRSAFF